MKPNWPDVDPQAVQLTLESLRKSVATPTNRAFYQIRQMLSSGLTLRDNMNAAIVTIPCVHGTEVPFSKGTLTGLPIAFTPLSTSLTNGAAALPVTDTPAINYARTDGYLGLTVNFAPPSGRIIVFRAAGLNQTNTDALLPFDSTESQGPGGLSLAGGAVTCASAGILQANYTVGWVAGAGTYRITYMTATAGAGNLYGLIVATQGANNTTYSGAAQIPVTAGQSVSVRTNQDTAGVLAVIPAAARTRLDLNYVAPPVGYSANVIGILWGG